MLTTQKLALMDEGEHFELDYYYDPETEDFVPKTSSKSPRREGMIDFASDEESDTEDEHSVVESEHGASSSTTSALNQKALHAKNSAKQSSKTPRFTSGEQKRKAAIPREDDIRVVHYHMMKMSDIDTSIQELKEKNLIAHDYSLKGVRNDNFRRKLKYITETISEHPKLGFHDMDGRQVGQLKTAFQNIIASSEILQKAFRAHPTANSYEEMLPDDINFMRERTLYVKENHEREMQAKKARLE